MAIYRPPKTCLSLFWTLTEGNDEKRVEAAIELVKMVQAVEKKEEREEITTYCINRLIRGLSSKRMFARVGFSTALTLLLRLQSEIKTSQLLNCVKQQLKAEANAFSKSEKAGLYLGRIFAISAIIQSGRIAKIKGELLDIIVEELLTLAGKRSFLKPVCSKAMEDLIAEVSEDNFGEHVWPKAREKLAQGWEDCTLDRISLLLVCKNKFPNIVNKSFIKKHWGPSIFSEDNDTKLIDAVTRSSEKSSALLDKIVPSILTSGRDALSVWKGFGEKLLLLGRDSNISVHQLLSLKILCELVKLTSDSQQILSMLMEPSVTKVIFKEYRTESKATTDILDTLISNLTEKLKMMDGYVLKFVKSLLKLEGETETDAAEGKLSYIHTTNYNKIVSMMNNAEMEQYVSLLINYVKGKDNNEFFSDASKKRKRQLDWCFRQLQSVTTSQSQTTQMIQQQVLTLFLRNGFFKADGKNSTILHCDYLDHYVETDDIKKLCESFLFKSLDKFSTLRIGPSKGEQSSSYMDLLSHLVQYFQSLLSCKDLQLVSSWSNETHDMWKQLMKRINSLEKTEVSSLSSADSAFRLLYLYVAFYILADVKAASDLLKDAFICQDKSTEEIKEEKKRKKKKARDEEEPYWVEVLIEILLQLLSQNSHLARVVASMVFEFIIPYVNTDSLSLITQALIPNKAQQSAMFEENNEEEGEDEETKNGDLLDEDIPSEESDDNDDNSEEEGDEEIEDDEDDEDDQMDVDENLRASVKEALGNAAVEDDDDEEDDEDLPDLSDSEMSKLDDALAEVFRQRKRKAVSKKAREEKRKEMGNFRLRALDLVDVIIRSSRCGDFLVDILRPLLVLMFQSTRVDEQATNDRAKSSFQLLLKSCKGKTDTLHSEAEQVDLFQELLDLARKVKNGGQLKPIAVACRLVIKVCKSNCLELVKDSLSDVINKRESKPLPSFFISLIDSDPDTFHPLSTWLVDCLENDSINVKIKSMVFSLLIPLTQKRPADSELSAASPGWMTHAAQVVGKLIHTLDKNNVKSLFVRELLTLTLKLVDRSDVLSADDFDDGIVKKLQEIKSKSGTDNRKTINKISAAFARFGNSNSQGKKKKRKAHEKESPKKENEVSENHESSNGPNPKKKRKKKENHEDT